MSRIGIYGGTFNPPHLGHIKAAAQAAKMLRLDKLLLIPAAVPPHKVLPEGSATPEQRLELVSLAAQGMDGFFVSDLELRRGGQSYTADTVRELHRAYPGDRLYLIMGTDMLASFHHWYQPKVICKYATLAVLMREKKDQKLRRWTQAQAASIRNSFGGRVRLLQNSILPMSSTDVRRMLVFHGGETLLPNPVYHKIQSLGLYGVNEDLRGLSSHKLEEKVKELVDARRIRHVLGCRDVAVALARRYGADVTDAERAGLLHDITKALSAECQITLCRSYGVPELRLVKENDQTLHALTGALVARNVFGENDAVCRAIESHTTGCVPMDVLQKIVYIADYIEPTRDFPGVERLRVLAQEDLDGAVLLGLRMTMEHLRQQGRPLAQGSLETEQWLVKQLK